VECTVSNSVIFISKHWKATIFSSLRQSLSILVVKAVSAFVNAVCRTLRCFFMVSIFLFLHSLAQLPCTENFPDFSKLSCHGRQKCYIQGVSMSGLTGVNHWKDELLWRWRFLLTISLTSPFFYCHPAPSLSTQPAARALRSSLVFRGEELCLLPFFFPEIISKASIHSPIFKIVLSLSSNAL